MKPMRVYAEINLEAICHNIREYQNRVGSNTKIMAVVKADAYGHGAVAVAQALRGIGIYGFAVATVEEGVELRISGITEPILILGHVFPDALQRAIDHDLMLTVYDLEDAEEIDKTAMELGKKAMVHIKVDTGMGRIGFQPEDASVEAVVAIDRLPHLTIEGIFTHFACADQYDKTSMNTQIAKFKHFVAACEVAGVTFPVRHMCNSAAAMEKEEGFLDMIRVGITMYGLWPSDEVARDHITLSPAMSLISHISWLKEVGPGFTVSYGSTYTTTAERTVIATVPVGYADGYPRQLSNKGYVLIGGVRCPVIGRVCMDQFMVDVTAVPDVKRNDEVVLVGCQGDQRITMEELGDLSGRFNYEFACDINKRVPRVYK